MLFNLGFTADAAAAHRHEFSQTPPAKDERQTEQFKFSMPLPSIPDLYPLRTPKPPDVAPSNRPTPSLTSKSSQPSIVYSSSDEGLVDDNATITSTSIGAAGRPVTVRKRSARPKTVFQFAHPVTSHRRLRLRPRLLLQLHESNQMSRPVPKYDVLPAAFAPRLASKFPKLFGSLRGLGPRDLVIVTSDMYEQHGLEDDDRSVSSDELSPDRREVVATLCQPVKDDPQRGSRVEIISRLGASWEGIRLANGSYELVSKGGPQPRKVRWVARDKATRRVSSMSATSEYSLPGPKRFTFSVIDPNSRRHPVIASMTRNGMEVFEQYSLPADSFPDETASPSPLAISAREARGELMTVEEELRLLIVTSGVWIAFMEGWSRNPAVCGEATSPVESPSAPRSKSSTFSIADRELPKDLFPPSRTDSTNRKKKMNRNSAQSDIGPIAETIFSERPARPKHRHSMAVDNHDQKWTDLNQVDESGEEEHNHDQVKEDDSRAKPKGWRRFGSIFGRKKR